VFALKGRRLALFALLLATAAGLGSLSMAQAPPASADVQPSPTPLLGLPQLLPSLPPLVSPLPLPTPVTSIVNQVGSAVPPLQPITQALNPSQSGQPAPAPSGGAGAGDGSATSGSQAGAGAQPAAAPPPYQPQPAEQAALPADPRRLALEAQQARDIGGAAVLTDKEGPIATAVGGGDGRFTWPIVFQGRPPITQRFGCTDLSIEPYSPDCATHHWHTGLDLAVPMGTPVYASAAGVAHTITTDTGYGNYVIVVHGNGWFTLYGHLSQFSVHEGDTVRRGDPIGLSGSTGTSTGPHVHFEVRYNSQYLDPCMYLGC
jgi:murein DD-endopeptidase MepM/ murein hydrolase activator NlpD